MKKFFLFFFVLGLSQLSWASEPAPFEAQAELRSFEPYRWLYEILVPETDRKSQPSQSEKTFRVHLQDSFSSFWHPDDIIRAHLNWPRESMAHVKGSITYVGFFKKPYRYDLISTGDHQELVFRVKIHFKNIQSSEKAAIDDKIKRAENLWNSHLWPRDFKYSFRFERVESAANAHFSVTLKDKTRGPYDTFWSRNWAHRTFAHEFGHMLGLGDEYQTLSGKVDCLTHSLMCTSSSGRLQAYHYYFILRRLLTSKGQFE